MWQTGAAAITSGSGTRIVAIYGDGSGARLFMVVDGEDGTPSLVDAEGDGYPLSYLDEADFLYWAWLPDDARLWFELRSD